MTYKEYKEGYDKLSEARFDELVALNREYIKQSGIEIGKHVRLDNGITNTTKYLVSNITVDDNYRLSPPEIIITGKKVSKNGTVAKNGYTIYAHTVSLWVEPQPIEIKPVTKQEVNKIKDDNEGIIPYVYLIDSYEFYKIGFSKNPHGRLRQIQSHSATTCTLLYKVVDNGGLEKKLHAKFKDLRSHGEWFSKHNSIVDEFKRLSTFTDEQKLNYVQGTLFSLSHTEI